MTTYKLKLVERSRIIDQIEIETTKLGYFTSMIDVWEQIDSHAKQTIKDLKQRYHASTAEDKIRYDRMSSVRKSMQSILSSAQLDKLMKKLERYNFTHPVWAPFTTDKERKHVSHGNAQRQVERKDPTKTDHPAGA
jgi:hypothetical protein